MAGIGFELRHLLGGRSYLRLVTAYVYAGVVSAGPWLLSIFGILLLCTLTQLKGMPYQETVQFQNVVIYLISGSLLLSSLLQQSYARFVADLCFSKRYDEVVPNLNGVLFLVLLISSLMGAWLVSLIFQTHILQLKVTIEACFVVLSLIWVLTSVLSGLKAYKTILFAFLLTYGFIFVVGYALRGYGILGLLTSFLCGQFILLTGLLYIVYRHYPTHYLIRFDFFRFNTTVMLLAGTGLFYTFGVWVDKFIFWYQPLTGTALFAQLHYSLVYDLPIFIAYLCTVPAMTCFLLWVETDYMDAYQALYWHICEGGTLAEIRDAMQSLVNATRDTLYSVIKTQILVQIVVFSLGEPLFHFLSIPVFYLPIFNIVVLGAGLGVIFWATLDMFFYLDKLFHALLLTILFALTNGLFTLVSVNWGIYYFGYGLVSAMLVTVIASFVLLNYDLKHLVFETFMTEVKQQKSANKA